MMMIGAIAGPIIDRSICKNTTGLPRDGGSKNRRHARKRKHSHALFRE